MLLSEMCDGSHSFILVFLWDVRWFSVSSWCFCEMCDSSQCHLGVFEMYDASQCHLGVFVRCAMVLSAILVFLWDVWWFSQCHLGVFVRCAMVLTVSSWCFCENKGSNLTHLFPIHFFFGNKCVNPFYPNVSFLWPLKTSEKHWSSMVFMLKNCIPVSSEQ